jgi:hypothetical protein
MALSQNGQVSLLGGFTKVYKYGSEEDYIRGENDFPVTPAHTPMGFGLSFGYYFHRFFGLELDGKFVLSSSVILEDPSDQDTVEINTAKHVPVTLNLLFRFMEGEVQPYLAVGGGFDRLIIEDETYTTDYGYEITIPAPTGKECIDPVAQLGGGICIFFGSHFGLKIDARLMMIFSSGQTIYNFNTYAGLVIGF